MASYAEYVSIWWRHHEFTKHGFKQLYRKSHQRYLLQRFATSDAIVFGHGSELNGLIYIHFCSPVIMNCPNLSVCITESSSPEVWAGRTRLSHNQNACDICRCGHNNVSIHQCNQYPPLLPHRTQINNLSTYSNFVCMHIYMYIYIYVTHN